MLRRLINLSTLVAALFCRSASAQSPSPVDVLRADLVELSDLRTNTAAAVASVPFTRDIRTQAALQTARAELAAASDCLTLAAGLVEACANAAAAMATATANGQTDLAKRIAAIYDGLHTQAAAELADAQTHLTTAAAAVASILPTP